MPAIRHVFSSKNVIAQRMAMLSVIAIIGCQQAYGQTAGSILKKHFRASRGANARVQVKGLTLRGDAVRTRDGKAGSYTAVILPPDKFLEEVAFGEKRTTAACNGKVAWRRDPTGIVTTLTGNEAALMEMRARDLGALVPSSASEVWPKGRFAGKETVHGRPAYRVEFTQQGKGEATIFFDAQTYLILQEKAEVGNSSVEMSFNDYRPFAGAKLPARMEVRRGSETILVANIEAVYDRAVVSAAFDFPVPRGEPVPDVAGLLSEVQKNQKAIDEILENYTYRKVEEEMDVDDQGRIKNKRKREYEVFYVNGHEVQKLVGKDGTLSPEEQDKQEERVKKLVLEYTSAGAKHGFSAREGRDEDELHISTFLRAARFTHARRESFRDRQVITFDIEPNPGYHPQNLDERLVQKLAGVMWVDAQAHQVVRLQAHLADSAKIGGGLVGSIQKGSAAVFEQTLINNEVWLPSYLEEHLSGRFLLIKSYRADLVIRYADYKKFRVEVEANQGPRRTN